MAARLLRDPEADGWERSDFPIVCETCLGPNPYVRMQRIEYGGECHISGRPYTVFRWRPGSDARYKKTIICQEVAKAKNVCQVCLLDLDYNLPVQVRDTALGNDEEPLPESDVNKEFQLQRMADEGTLDSSFAKAKANDTILRLQRTTPYYKRNQAPICSFYVKGECKRGAECPYRHEMPQTGELAEQNIKDRYYGVNDPVAKKMMRRVDEMPKLVPPEDTSITTLYVGGLTPDMGSEDLRDKFYAYGEIQSIKVLSARHCAFVTFTTRAAAEKAAEELNNRLIINGSRLKLMWGRPQEKRPEADPMQPYPAPAMLPPQVQMQMGGAAPFEPAGAKFFNLPPVGAAPAVAAYPSMDPMAMGTRVSPASEAKRAPNSEEAGAGAAAEDGQPRKQQRRDDAQQGPGSGPQQAAQQGPAGPQQTQQQGGPGGPPPWAMGGPGGFRPPPPMFMRPMGPPPPGYAGPPPGLMPYGPPRPMFGGPPMRPMGPPMMMGGPGNRPPMRPPQPPQQA